MKSIALSFSLLFAFGCGGENNASDRALIGWDFDYRNWVLDECECDSCTDNSNCSVPDPRDCNNVSTLSDGSANLAAIDSVQVQLRHTGMTAIRYDQTFDCAEGAGIDTARIRAVEARVHVPLALTARRPRRHVLAIPAVGPGLSAEPARVPPLRAVRLRRVAALAGLWLTQLKRRS